MSSDYVLCVGRNCWGTSVANFIILFKHSSRKSGKYHTRISISVPAKFMPCEYKLDALTLPHPSQSSCPSFPNLVNCHNIFDALHYRILLRHRCSACSWNTFVQDWRRSFTAVVIIRFQSAEHLGIMRYCLLAPRKTDICMPSFELRTTLLSENILHLGLPNSNNNNNVTCKGCAWLIDGFWIGWSDLLAPYTLHLELQTVTAPSLIYTLYSSPLHPLVPSVFTSRVLATDS
jgi:hypothetical protein